MPHSCSLGGWNGAVGSLLFLQSRAMRFVSEMHGSWGHSGLNVRFGVYADVLPKWVGSVVGKKAQQIRNHRREKALTPLSLGFHVVQL